jgi:uncharacterized membrane protein YczE
MNVSPRAFWISQLVAFLILAVGVWLVNASELGTFPVMVASFGIGITLFHKLEDREKRRKSGDA